MKYGDPEKSARLDGGYKHEDENGIPLSAWDRIIKCENGCWEWQGPLSHGYSYFYHRGTPQKGHRVFYTMFKGAIPVGMVLDHLCRNRACVNPEHLEPVTDRENILRGVGCSATNATKTHCVNGHEYDEQNTGIKKDGSRYCRTCKSAQNNAAYQKRKARNAA